MEVVDKADGKKAEQVEDEVSFMVTNRKGSFCVLSNCPKSRFEGLFFREGNNVYKVIDSLKFSQPVTKIVNQLWSVSRERAELSENFFMPLNINALIYELNQKAEFDLMLDCRQIYDNRQWGRSYELSKEPNCLVIKFSKKNNSQDDNTRFSQEFDIYTAIYSDSLEYRPAGAWEKIFYELDKERDSMPFEKHVYNACKIRCQNMAFAFSTNRKDAISEAKYAWRNRESLKKEKEKHVSSLIHKKSINENDIAVAYQCSLNALDSLIVGDLGISAGLPWFFQFWARDELISLKALMSMGEYSLAKKILFRYLDLIGHDGLVAEKNINPEIKSADGTLWIFKRIGDFMAEAGKKGLKKMYFSRRETSMIKDKLNVVISQWEKYHMQDGLVINGPKETWMDSEWDGDNRAGARIEMQALFLSCLKLLRSLEMMEDPIEKELARKVKKMMFKDNIIYDGLLDSTIRPNAFIAAYAYPELLSRKEWVKCFEKMIPKIWLSWGGFASIDKSSKLYVSHHTGEIPRSYHRGDSWFWLNNLAAIVLRRLDSHKFKKYIDKIIEASTKEMLYIGVTGYSSELSSAAELKSQGCFCQAWSSALYIELIDEIYK